MTELMKDKIQNLEHPDVQKLLNQFKDRHNMNIVDVAEIISKLILMLKMDYNAGRPKELGTISGEHLGQLLGVGKGVISQYMSIWNMPEESKNFLKSYKLSLINAYYVSRGKGRDEAETIKVQKDIIIEKNINPSTNGTDRKTEVLIHAINEAQMVLNGIVTSYKVSPEVAKMMPVPDKNSKKHEDIVAKAKVYIYNIDQCIKFISPKVAKLPYLQKEIEFCRMMLENNEVMFCGKEIGQECLNKQIAHISEQISLIEMEFKSPHIASLIMMRGNLEKNI